MKNNYKKYWWAFIAVMVGSFAVLLFFGREIYKQAPPIPQQVVDAQGNVVMSMKQIQDGQNVWQSIGGQDIGSIWGHGAYQAPDWSADYLHREAMFILNEWAQTQFHKNYDVLTKIQQAPLQLKLQEVIRKNTYDATTGTLHISDIRARAFKSISSHYTGLFMGAPKLHGLREAYALKEHTLYDAVRMNDMNAFFFWTSWACVTERSAGGVSYSNNWPHEPLVGNEATSSLLMWSLFSVVILIAGILFLSFFHAKEEDGMEEEHELPQQDPMFGLKPTPSMKATLKYFWVVAALFVLQVGMGALTAHYGVEGQAFFGLDLSAILPYAVTRSWHLQLAILWIATSWLATGLFIAPAVAGFEPKFQKLGVDILFVALFIVVGGSMAGQWFSIMQKMGLTASFWFGHQGYEYVELGRFWQILLFAGLGIWLVLMGRCLVPAIKNAKENKSLLTMFLISSAAIGLFYGAGLMWGRHTNLSMAEYWRWWVVHLWVEGFFEVFATVVIAFLFTRLGLVKVESATKATLGSATIFLFGGILGTFHHLYFTGTPTGVMAVGAAFSALEIAPLSLLGFEAYSYYKQAKKGKWLQRYKWPINYFISVAFWNGLGAGVFGFLINPPIALYYMQGLNLTPVHGHTALFGVYGMLGIGLTLFSLRAMAPSMEWSERLMKNIFWSLNIGLLAMTVISILPIGIAQTFAAMDVGLWYARSAEFLQNPTFQSIRWSRVFGDVIFTFGLLSLVYFIFTFSKSYLTGKTEVAKTEKEEELV